jgi:hypothetical protein
MSAKTLDAMIVGVEKAGTTSLLNYLSQHPEIASHTGMEFPYFVKEELYQNGWDNAFSQYFRQDIGAALLLGKSVGCIYWAEAALRLFRHNPAIKLIAVLRNPMDRAYSAYWYAVQMGREDTNTFEQAIDLESERLRTGEDFHLRYHAYLRRGLYAAQLESLLEFFSPDQIKVVLFEEFKNKPQVVTDEIFDFLGVAHAPVDVSASHNTTVGSRGMLAVTDKGALGATLRRVSWILPMAIRERLKTSLRSLGRREMSIPPMKGDTRERLAAYFEPDMSRLECFLGRDVNIWRQ